MCVPLVPSGTALATQVAEKGKGGSSFTYVRAGKQSWQFVKLSSLQAERNELLTWFPWFGSGFAYENNCKASI